MVRSLLAASLGLAAFLTLAIIVWRSEQTDSGNRAAGNPVAILDSSPVPTVALPAARPYDFKACQEFLAAVEIPPEVTLTGEALLHAILFAYQDVASIWKNLSQDEIARIAPLMEACLDTDPNRPTKFPRG